MPAPMPVQFLDHLGHRVQVFNDDYPEPSGEQLVAAYSAMVIGRRFDIQATALAKQGRLAVYPPSRGQEACQIGSMLALSQDDWAFPTYRDSMALVTRGIDPVEVLTCRTAPPTAASTPGQTGPRHSARRWQPS
jgi:Pyruvate/2-oxoglutarate dehydrogenase complex, dehydrogenase (E1) component, eukaryotic type, alpha subunit